MALAKHAEEIQEKIWDNETKAEERWGYTTDTLFPYDEPDHGESKGGES